MKFLAVILLSFVSAFANAQAAPYLLADETSAIDAASFTINGGAPINCIVQTTVAGKIKCPLDSINAPGTYTLVVKAIQNPGIVNTPTGATNSAGGSAVSAPFQYTLNLATVAIPGSLKVAP